MSKKPTFSPQPPRSSRAVLALRCDGFFLLTIAGPHSGTCCVMRFGARVVLAWLLRCRRRRQRRARPGVRRRDVRRAEMTYEGLITSRGALASSRLPWPACASFLRPIHLRGRTGGATHFSWKIGAVVFLWTIFLGANLSLCEFIFSLLSGIISVC